jgi:hypothetical protein
MTFRHWLRVVAVFLIGCGLDCLPNPGGSPKRLTSLFHILADSGSFFYVGLLLAVSGLVLLLVTYIGGRE